MKSDSEIKRDVEDELRWDLTSIRRYAVAVKSWVRHLTGFVRRTRQKFAADVRPSAWRGVGVPMISKCAYPCGRREPILKSRVMSGKPKTLAAELWARSKLIVKNGWVTLEGEVAWNYQRD